MKKGIKAVIIFWIAAAIFITVIVKFPVFFLYLFTVVIAIVVLGIVSHAIYTVFEDD